MKLLTFIFLVISLVSCDKTTSALFKYEWTLDGQTPQKVLTVKKESGKQVILNINSNSLCASHGVTAILRLDKQVIDSIEITEIPFNRNIIINAEKSGDLEVMVSTKDLKNGIDCVWFGEVKCELYEVE